MGDVWELGFRWISLVTFLPLLGAVIVLFIDRAKEAAIRMVSLITTVVTFVLSIPLFFLYQPVGSKLYMAEPAVDWIPRFGIKYFVAIDGISLFLVLLTTFLGPLVVLQSWRYIDKKIKEYFFAMLFLETAMLGVFVAFDLFLFYLFWEAMLIPMYLIIGVWGGPRRIYAALKFFIYTMVGSVLMLAAILFQYFAVGQGSFDYFAFVQSSRQMAFNVQTWLFLAYALAFAIKVPMFPFHTWLADAHTEAPTAGSVILAGVLLKMGTYGFIRFAMPMFPYAAYKFAPIICILAIIGIIYGALVSMVQKDVKRLVAFSSVSHLGFVMLGLFVFTMQGVQGGVLQMINHGLSTGALFLLVGILYERRHTRMIADFGGISKVMPAFAAIFMIVALSSIGLPGTNGFIGEFLILLGSFKAKSIYAILAGTGVILAAVYMLWMYQRVMFGKITHPENEKLADLNVREFAYLLSIVVFIFWIGFYPNTFLKKMEPSVQAFLLGSGPNYVQALSAEELAQLRGEEIVEVSSEVVK